MMRLTPLFTFAALLMVRLASLDAADDRTGQDLQTPASRPEAGLTREQRIQWWREAKFDIFIHWGLYDGLTLTVPREKPCRYAFVYRIDFKKRMR